MRNVMSTMDAGSLVRHKRFEGISHWDGCSSPSLLRCAAWRRGRLSDFFFPCNVWMVEQPIYSTLRVIVLSFVTR